MSGGATRSSSCSGPRPPYDALTATAASTTSKLAAFAGAMNELHPVGSRASRREVAPFRRQPHGVRLLGQGCEITLVDQVPVPSTLRPQPARPNPTPDRLWVSTRSMGGLRNGEHAPELTTTSRCSSSFELGRDVLQPVVAPEDLVAHNDARHSAHAAVVCLL